MWTYDKQTETIIDENGNVIGRHRPATGDLAASAPALAAELATVKAEVKTMRLACEKSLALRNEAEALVVELTATIATLKEKA